MPKLPTIVYVVTTSIKGRGVIQVSAHHSLDAVRKAYPTVRWHALAPKAWTGYS